MKTRRPELLAPIAVLLLAMLLVATGADAVNPSDKGIRQNFGGVQLTQPYGTIQSHAAVGAKTVSTSSLGLQFSSAVRGDLVALTGGRYDNSTQTAYPGFNAQVQMVTAGQAMGLFSYVTGYGKGNVMGLNNVLGCWGGGEIEVGSDSIPECSPIGEVFSQWGNLIWRGDVTGSPAANATSISFTPVAHDQVLGKRLILNYNHTYSTGTFQSFGVSNTVTLSGSTLTSLTQSSGQANPTWGWYFKVGTNTDFYNAPCSGDDVEIETGICVGHWYHVIAIDDNTHLRLGMIIDTLGLNVTAGLPYLLMQGAEAVDVDQTAHTITIPTNNMTWSNGDALYSPPNHWMRQTGVIVDIDHPYKDLEGAVENQGNLSAVMIARQRGPQLISAGIILEGNTSSPGTGGFRRGLVIGGYQGDGYRAIDLNGPSACSWSDAAISIPASSGTNNAIKMGDATLLCDNTVLKLDPGSGNSVELDRGIYNNGSGMKHGRQAGSSLASGDTESVTVSWGTAFGDTSYTATCTSEDSSGLISVWGITSKATTGVTVTVKNWDSSAHTPTVDCTGIHD